MRPRDGDLSTLRPRHLDRYVNFEYLSSHWASWSSQVTANREDFVILTDGRWVFEDLRSVFAVGTSENPTSVCVCATAGHHPVLVSRASQKAVESPCHLIADRSVAVKGDGAESGKS
jgi:hypothetical protein